MSVLDMSAYVITEQTISVNVTHIQSSLITPQILFGRATTVNVNLKYCVLCGIPTG